MIHDEAAFVKTLDGSPTLNVPGAGDYVEAMHNRSGALSETLYIYDLALQFALKIVPTDQPFKVLNVGLGLGYHEILVASLALNDPERGKRLHFESFESEEWLRENFKQWLRGVNPVAGHALLFKFYDEILTLIAAEKNQPPQVLKSVLFGLMDNQQWKLCDALNATTEFSHRFNAILYDPFSSEFDDELWDEIFLKNFLSKVIADNCVLATYAAKGSLNRALRAFGFLVDKKEGFGGKRESTFAVKVWKTASYQHSANAFAAKP